MIDRSPSGLPPDPNEPRFSRDELESVKFDDAEIEREIDEEQARGDEQMRKLGMSDAEIAKVRGRPVVDAAPQPTLADVERELAEIDQKRRTDKIRYFKDEALQKREVELIEARAKLKAEASGAVEASAANAEGISEGSLPEGLRQEWAKSGPGGIEDALRAVKFRTTMAFHGLDDGGEALRDSFDELPDDAQEIIASGLANDAGKWPVASPAEVQEFGELEHGRVLLQEWGPDGARLLGRAKREADAIMSRLTEGSKLKMHYWVAGRSPAELKGMVRALAARARRRL